MLPQDWVYGNWPQSGEIGEPWLPAALLAPPRALQAA